MEPKPILPNRLHFNDPEIAANFLFNDGTASRPLLLHEDNQGAKALPESAILS